MEHTNPDRQLHDLPCSIPVNQVNQPAAGQGSTDQIEIQRLLAEYRQQLSRLPAAAHGDRQKRMAAALRLRVPRAGVRLEGCGRIRVKGPPGARQVYPEYCFTRGCSRCGPVRGLHSAHKHMCAIRAHIKRGLRVFRVTLTQPRSWFESPASLLGRLERALASLKKQLRAKPFAVRLGYEGALVSIQCVSSYLRGHHVHAHLIWVADHLDADLLRSTWDNCLREASAGVPVQACRESVDVAEFDAREHRSVQPLRERLTEFIAYQLKRSITPKDLQDDGDLDAWACALAFVSAHRARLVRTWGVLNGRNGKKYPRAGEPVVDAASLPADDDQLRDLPFDQLVEEELNDEPVEYLDELMHRVSLANAQDHGRSLFAGDLQALREVLPLVARHVNFVVEAHSRFRPVSPGRYIDTPIIGVENQAEFNHEEQGDQRP